nr:MAG TPA: hypothetical protein [Caudoviricetes sp.]
MRCCILTFLPYVQKIASRCTISEEVCNERHILYLTLFLLDWEIRSFFFRYF